MEKHLFAFYLPELKTKKNEKFIIFDKDVIHRLKNVLRLSVGDSIILFDRTANALGAIENIEKKNVQVLIEHIELNRSISPHITVGLPLLKKEAFEQALYSCIELGASEIIPYVAAKTHRKNLNEREIERAKIIMQSAAEQSKYFAFPNLSQVKKLEDLLEYAGTKIFFDPLGCHINSIIKNAQASEKFLLMIGPEGDLENEEKEQLKNRGFIFCKLTPTILRARQAVASSLAVFRTLLS